LISYLLTPDLWNSAANNEATETVYQLLGTHTIYSDR